MAKVLTRVAGTADNPTWAADAPGTSQNKVLSQSLNGSNFFWEAGNRQRKVLTQSGSNVIWANNIATGMAVVITRFDTDLTSVGGSKANYYFNGVEVVGGSTTVPTDKGMFIQVKNGSYDRFNIHMTFIVIVGVGIIGYSMAVLGSRSNMETGGCVIEVQIKNQAGTVQKLYNIESKRSSPEDVGGATTIAISSNADYGGCTKGFGATCFGIIENTSAIPGLTKAYLYGTGPQTGIVAAVSNQGLSQMTTVPNAPDGYMSALVRNTFRTIALFYGGIPIALMHMDLGTETYISPAWTISGLSNTVAHATSVEWTPFMSDNDYRYYVDEYGYQEVQFAYNVFVGKQI